jgi:DNA-binding NarL/FixJ family response regulator
MKTAFILEDISETRQWLVDVLKSTFDGITVAEAGTIAQAKDVIAKQKFELAIIDLSLPDGSGTEILQAISATSPDTFCVVATIYDDDEHLFSALKAGARGYLLKEQSKEQIATLLKGIINDSPPLSPSISRRLLDHFNKPMPSEEENLTAREKDVLILISKGIKLDEVASMLGITRNTTAGYVKNIYRKLNISSRAEATLTAARMGLINPGSI